MDGSAVHPSWIPFGSAATAEDQMEFKLTLMTGILPLRFGLSVDFVNIFFFFILSHSHPLKKTKSRGDS